MESIDADWEITESMRILIASDCYKLNTNGVTVVILGLSDGLRQRGHEVKVLSLSNTRHSFRDGDDYYIRSLPSLFYPDVRTSLARKDPLIEEIVAWKPDIVHLHTDGSAHHLAVEIAERCGVPLVKTCHTYYDYYVFGRFRDLSPVKAFSGFVGGRLYKPADAVTVPSRKATEFPFLHKLRDQLLVIPNGLELEKYRNRFSFEERRAFRASLGIGDHTGVLVAVTRLSREKNIEDLISFFPLVHQNHPDVKMLLVGDGPDRKKLEKQAEKLNLPGSVIFSGRVPPEEVWQYYAAGDVYVSASTFEVHSMSYLEAMTNGLPLLCHADESLDGVLEHGWNGFIWHSGEEYADYACRLLDDESLREEMSLRSCQRAEKFSDEAFVSNMIGVYESVLCENGKGNE